VSIIGINHLGDPHKFPYNVYAAVTGGDIFGMGRLPGMVFALKPDVIVIQNDVWNIPAYVQCIREGGNGIPGNQTIPIVGIVAVDGKNCQGDQLNGLAATVFWTEFAEREARKGGFTGYSTVIPLGVDCSIYYPLDQHESRWQYGDPPSVASGQRVRPEWRDGFIVGGINRNQERKRFDLMVEYFCDWVEQYKVDDAILAIQSCPTGDNHVDVEQLMFYRGMRDRLLRIQPPIGQGFPEPYVNLFYNILDVALSTSQGEGWGLTTLEAMAAGKPCIVSDWAALGEWPGEAAIRIPCTTVSVNRLNVYGGVMDREIAIRALNKLYRDATYREMIAARGLTLAQSDRLNWRTIGGQFATTLDELVGKPVTAKILAMS
jgi:glycosyltransferase involved in cell wall biosynthesis